MPKRRAENTAERVKALFQQLEDGIREFFNSDDYKTYLRIMSQFHNYSCRNCMLILRQMPYATHVAGYNAWRDKFHRHVVRGEKGIQILGFAPEVVTRLEPVLDEIGQAAKNPDGTNKMERKDITVAHYVPVYVFDVSQTEGEPLPQLTRPLADQGELSQEQFQQIMKALEEVAPVPITTGELPPGCYGLCTPDKIVLRPGLSHTHALKTTVHEVAHSRLHTKATWVDADGTPDRPTRELQAESVAFLVCDHYGLDTSDYSFPYVASWSAQLEPSALMANMEIVQKEALAIIDQIDGRLAELEVSRSTALEQTEKILTTSAPSEIAPASPEPDLSFSTAPIQPANTPLGRGDGPKRIQEVVAQAKQRAEEQAASRNQLPDPILNKERGDMQ